MTFRESQLEAGKSYLLELMERHGWNHTTAAEEAGYNRTNFYRVLENHAIHNPIPRTRRIFGRPTRVILKNPVTQALRNW